MVNFHFKLMRHYYDRIFVPVIFFLEKKANDLENYMASLQFLICSPTAISSCIFQICRMPSESMLKSSNKLSSLPSKWHLQTSKGRYGSQHTTSMIPSLKLGWRPGVHDVSQITPAKGLSYRIQVQLLPGLQWAGLGLQSTSNTSLLCGLESVHLSAMNLSFLTYKMGTITLPTSQSYSEDKMR